MKSSVILILIGISMLACRTSEPTVQPIDPQQIEVDRQAALAKKLDEFRRQDMPSFDDSNTDRSLPYSPMTVPNRPRLLRASGFTYRYDSLGRLVEKYWNFAGTDIVASRQLYQYDIHGLQQSLLYGTSFYATPLELAGRVTFFTNPAGRIDSYFEKTNSLEGGPYLIRFDQSGHLIWKALLQDENSNTSIIAYRRAFRDEKHNVRSIRNTIGTFYTVDYEYDNNPNPFYLLSGPPDFTSPNNVTKETKRDIDGNVLSVTDYTYDYRADGYPVRKRSGTEVTDFVYAN